MSALPSILPDPLPLELDGVSARKAQSIARRTLDFHVTAVEIRSIHDSFGMP